MLSPAVANDPPPEVTATNLYEILAPKVNDILRSGERLRPLPYAITKLWASPTHLPVLSFSKQGTYAPDTVEILRKTGATPQETFRLIAEGEIVGWGQDDEVAVAFRSRQSGVIVSPEGARLINLPPGSNLQRAFRVRGQWVYYVYPGLISDGQTSMWPGTEDMRGTPVFIHDETDFAVLCPRRGAAGGGETWDGSLSIGWGIGEDWRITTYTNLPFRGVGGLLRTPDGRLITIGGKIAELNDGLRASPTEVELGAVLKAAEEENWPELPKLLKTITLYSTEKLGGLGRLLSELADRPRIGTEFKNLLATTAKELERLHAASVPPGQAELGEKLRPIMKSYLETTRQALRDAESISPASQGLSMKTIGELITRGYQYYDGQWIGSCQVLAQRGLSEAMVQLNYYDLDAAAGRWGVFRLDNDGRLHAVYLHESDVMPSSGVSICRDHAGGYYMYIRSVGLGRITADRFSWIDKGEDIRNLGSPVGCDRLGRLFFCQNTPHWSNNRLIYWVYHADGVRRPVTGGRCGPAGAAAVDTEGRLWFVANPSDPLATELIEGAAPARLTPGDTESQSVPSTPPSQKHALYCLDPDGVIRSHFLGEDLDSNSDLQSGLLGSVVVVTSHRTYVIHNDQVYIGKDLHDLAARQFSLLLELAPQRSESSVYISDYGRQKNWAWMACEGVLWISGWNRVEAYREGKPLLIDRRLNLLGVRLQRPLLLGPLGPGPDKNTRIVIACHAAAPLTSIWATQKPEGIELQPARYPSNNMISDGIVVGISNIEGPCLVDHKHGRIFYCRTSEDYVWEVSGPTDCVFHGRLGQPVLVADDGRLLVNRQARGFEGFRWVEPGSVTDILLTYVEPLKVASEQGKGKYLCLAPDGIAWIHRDQNEQYVVTRHLRSTMRGVPSAYIGRSAKRVYVRTSMHEIVVIPTGDVPSEQ